MWSVPLNHTVRSLIVPSVLVWLSAAPLFALDKHLEWQTLANEAKAAEEKGDYKQAESLWQRGLESQNQMDGGEWWRGSSLNGLGSAELGLGKNAEADAHLHEAMIIFEHAGGTADKAAVLRNLARLYLKQGRKTEAEAMSAHAVVLMDKVTNKKPAELVPYLAVTAETKVSAGDYRGAISLLERGLRLSQQQFGSSDSRTKEINLRIKDIQSKMKEGKSEMKALEKLL